MSNTHQHSLPIDSVEEYLSQNHVDILAIGAHPDDCEMSVGGVLADAVLRGKRVGIIDATRGELGSRGTVQTREVEAANATAILGIHHRENLNLPDGGLSYQCQEYTHAIVRVIRKYTPKIMLIPPAHDRHPDHGALHTICKNAYFQSGLLKISCSDSGHELPACRPSHMFSYIQSLHVEPDFVVDISSTFTQKMAAVRAFSTQVFSGIPTDNDCIDIHEPQTYISRPEFMDMLIARATYFGEQAGFRYGEGFTTISMLGIPTLTQWIQA